MPEYSLQFKKQMVQKMVGPGKRSATELSQEVGHHAADVVALEA